MHKSVLVRRLENATGSSGLTSELYAQGTAQRAIQKLKENPNKLTRIKTLIAKAVDAKGDIDAFKKAIDAYEDQDNSFESRALTARRARILAAWLATVQMYDPDATIETIFIYTVVKTYLLKFLPVMVCFYFLLYIQAPIIFFRRSTLRNPRRGTV